MSKAVTTRRRGQGSCALSCAFMRGDRCGKLAFLLLLVETSRFLLFLNENNSMLLT